MLRTLAVVIVTMVMLTVLGSETFGMGDGRRHRRGATATGEGGTFSSGGSNGSEFNTSVSLDGRGNFEGPLSSVPEPTTLLLLASGTVGLVSWMRRRM